jgi:hypothetical protein
MKLFTVKRATAVLLVLVFAVGGGNLWASWNETHAVTAQLNAFKQQLHAQEVTEQKQGAKEVAELCATFGKVALLKPPAGDPKTNPSRAFDQNMHADLAGVVPDLRCKTPGK